MLAAGNDLVNQVEATVDEITDPETADATTTITSAPALAVSKLVDQASITQPATLNYTIEVSNTGNVSLTNVALNDTLPDGSVAVLTGPINDIGIAGALDVGEVWTYSGSYAVSQSEVDEGFTLTNTVDVTSTETGNDSVSASALTTINRLPAFEVAKNVDLASITSPGQLSYTITAENTGNVSLNNVVITDTAPDGTAATFTGPLADVGLPDSIDVGEVWTWTATYTVTQADIDAGNVLVNSATVTTDEAGSATDTAETDVSQSPGISIAKSTSATAFTTVGEVIEYAQVSRRSNNSAVPYCTQSQRLTLPVYKLIIRHRFLH